MNKIKPQLFFPAMILILLIIMLFAISVGSVRIPISNVMQELGDLFRSRDIGNSIIRDIRLPRVIFAIIIGANLSIAGVLLQAVMQNPMADSGITGISTGASVTVVFFILYLPQYSQWLPLVGFLGSAIACLLVYTLAWQKGITAMRIILAGIAVNAILGGVTGMMNILNSEKLQGVLGWLNGNLGKVGFSDLKAVMLYSLVGWVPLLFLTKICNVLALGDKTAKSLGINPNHQRIIISVVAVYLAGISTAFCGIIGFIGLMVPHIARLLIGSNHKYLIPFSGILGAMVLLLADTFGRTIAPPYQIPVGIVMAVLGGPFFLYLLRKGGKNYAS